MGFPGVISYNSDVAPQDAQSLVAFMSSQL